MAGGPPPTGLVAAAAHAGAFGFLARGYKTAARVRAGMGARRAAGAECGTCTNDGAPDRRPGLPDLLAEVAEVAERTGLPLIAAGGMADPAGVAAALDAGAAAASLGTAFLRCPESGAHHAAQDGAGGPAVHRHRGHAGVQRPPGPGAGQPVPARPSRRARRVPGDQ